MNRLIKRYLIESVNRVALKLTGRRLDLTQVAMSTLNEVFALLTKSRDVSPTF
ncbi:MAG: hypothetical protein ACK518_03220 [bacterium]